MNGSESPRLAQPLPILPEDRWCRPGALDNPLRRWLLPAEKDLARLRAAPGLSVADLGAGVGFHGEAWLRTIGPNGALTLVDPDEENLSRFTQRHTGDPRLTVIVGSAARVPGLPDASQDRVLLSLVLCCLVDKAGAMDEAWRILRPGGLLLATFPRARKRVSRRRPLRLSYARWDALRAMHPWEELPVRRSFWVHRHLLRKPTG
jgi:SAM-dependent methyltransferase